MNSTLAIVHYHLNRGGVTSVIRNQLRALQATGSPFERIVLLYGGRADEGLVAAVDDFASLRVVPQVVPQLEYDSLLSLPQSLDVAINQLTSGLQLAIERTGGTSGSTLLHVHNHALGKNRALPGSVRQLALTGFRCLLQIHDFAEDLRPEAYRHLTDSLGGAGRPSVSSQLYPQARQIHYAVLNGRDFQVLRWAGVGEAQLHYLPNPVDEPPALPPRHVARQKLAADLPAQRPVMLYPVRGIRRKNVGEFLLWAAVFRRRASFVLSLAPQNPNERRPFDRFMRLARQLQLPVHVDTGGAGGLTWAENVAACDVMLTTSIAEGFGMVFLESWLTGRALVGRDLPEITSDFRAAGMDLSSLSPTFWVPVGWLGRSEILNSLQHAYRQLLLAYGLPALRADRIDPLWAELVGESAVDFARLPPTLQAKVLHHVAGGGAAAISTLEDLNPWLSDLPAGRVESGDSRVEANASAVRRSFGVAAVGRRLQQVYGSVLSAEADEMVVGLDGADTVLPGFVAPRRLYPIRFA